MKYKFIINIILLVMSITLITGCTEHKNKVTNNESDINLLLTEIDEYTPEETLTCNADSYDMDLKLDTDKKVLSGNIIMNLTNKTEDILDKICIRNYAASAWEKGKKGSSLIRSAVLADTNDILTIDVKKDPSVVYLDFSKHQIKPGESVSVKLNFITDIPNYKYRFGYHSDGNNQIFQLSFCFPTISMYEDGQWNESPFIFSGAESNFNKVADYNVKLEVPEDYIVVASGDEKTDGLITTISGSNMRELAIIASNYMKVETETTENGIIINNYTLDYDIEEYNNFSMDSARDSIELYSTLFGDYPYKELDVVQTFQNFAMEYPGLIMIGFPDLKEIENILQNASYLELCAKVSHEVAHQWFYAAIGSDPYKEPWLDECFAEYCEDVLYRLSGAESYVEAMKSDEKRLNKTNIFESQSEEEFNMYMDDYVNQITGEKFIINKKYDEYHADEYSKYIYEGGKMFLYELRKSMGDSAFFNTLREYYNNYCFKEAKGIDFIKLVMTFDDSEETKKVICKYIE